MSPCQEGHVCPKINKQMYQYFFANEKYKVNQPIHRPPVFSNFIIKLLMRFQLFCILFLVLFLLKYNLHAVLCIGSRKIHWRRGRLPTPVFLGFLCGSDGEESRRPGFLQCGRPWFDPWVGKIPWRREQVPTPVFWPGESHGL